MAKDAKFGVKEVMNVTFYSLTDHKPVLYIDTLKLSNLENTAEESQARGGHGNPILLTWDYNREANFAVQDALISFEGFALMTGMDTANLSPADAIVYKREILTVTGGAATLSEEPVDPGTGLAATTRLFIYDAVNGIAGNEVTYTYASGTGVTAISGLSDGNDKIVAYYPYKNTETGIRMVTINSDDFPGYYKVVGDTLIRDASTGEDEPFQLIIDRAKIEPGFSVTMEAEGDPSVFDMNLKAMRPTDGTTMVKMIKYTEGS